MSRLHQGVMRILIEEIVRGTYQAGERLPRETDLSAQFEVSRGVARECVRGLEERGLVRVKHGLGAIVKPSQEWDSFDPDVLEALLQAPNAGSVLTDYLECRRILEIEAAGLAAQRATEAHIAALTSALDEMRTSAERARATPMAEDRYHEADIAFHREVIWATGNQALGHITEPIHRALSAALRRLARPEFRFERGLPEHQRILEAVASHDPGEARAAMDDHLATVARYLDEYRKEQQLSPAG
jgi:DNA-binding FadR family transcriptional regulator